MWIRTRSFPSCSGTWPEDLKRRGEVVKTFSTTQMVDKLAAKYGLPLHVTPIGFKYICELMLNRGILIGGEESGGIAVGGHLPGARRHSEFALSGRTSSRREEKNSAN